MAITPKDLTPTEEPPEINLDSDEDGDEDDESGRGMKRAKPVPSATAAEPVKRASDSDTVDTGQL